MVWASRRVATTLIAQHGECCEMPDWVPPAKAASSPTRLAVDQPARIISRLGLDSTANRPLASAGRASSALGSISIFQYLPNMRIY